MKRYAKGGLLGLGLAFAISVNAAAPAPDTLPISRFPGSVIIGVSQPGQADYQVLTDGKTESRLPKGRRVEGTATAVAYRLPTDATGTAVYNAYRSGLKNAGFEIGLDCGVGDCAPGTLLSWARSQGRNTAWPDVDLAEIAREQHYAMLTGWKNGDTAITVLVAPHWKGGDGKVVVDLIEPSAQGDAAVGLAATQSQMGVRFRQNNRLVLEGLQFESGGNRLEDGSNQVLARLAAYLDESGTQVYIVGYAAKVAHLRRDPLAVGGPRCRAVAVSKRLQRRFGVSEEALQANCLDYPGPRQSTSGESSVESSYLDTIIVMRRTRK